MPRPKGSARIPGSGRQKGTPNRKTVEAAQALVAAAATSDVRLSDAVLAQIDAIDTLKYVMRVALKANQITLAMDAASRLAPFQAPKLQNLSVETMQKKTMLDYSDAELADIVAGKMDLTDEALADGDSRSEQNLQADIERLQAELNRKRAERDKVARPRG